MKNLAPLVAGGGEVCAAGKQGTRGGRSGGWGTTGACGGKAQLRPPGDGGPSHTWDLHLSIRLTRCGSLGPAPTQGVGISGEICILTTAPHVFLGKRNGHREEQKHSKLSGFVTQDK